MDFDNLEKLLQLMRSYNLAELQVKEGDTEIKLVQTAQASMATPSAMNYLAAQGMVPPIISPFAATQAQSPAESKAAAAENKTKYHEIRSPFVGTFYGGPSPGAEDFVKVGARVKKGDTLCIVEAMKMMNEIEAEKEGTIVKILVSNEQPVEFDQVLFHIE